MILNIFDDIWTKITELADDFYDLIMENYDEPFLWIIIFVVLAVVAYSAISSLSNK